MKVLLDENLPHRLRTALVNHEVVTASYMGWKGLSNGLLIAAAESGGIEVLLTGDGNLAYQQNIANRLISVVTVSEVEWPVLEPHLNAISEAIARAVPGSFHFVDCGNPGE